ncbi:MAG: Eco57I restriction-modification methylase domain-containing protein, partial [Deltaproteobacteria bacterium]|nr:Eco57I restriction-modification methylase domain-containing protein [Deltaproteobacteria bacterium]
DVVVEGQTFTLTAIAEKRGMVAFTCVPPGDGRIPDYPTRRKIERQVGNSVHEHLIIYTDAAKTTQIWQWVKREAGRPTACREHTYQRHQPGDALMQKLQAIAFSLDEEESLTIVHVSSRARAAFDVDRVTKRFYDRFKAEHDAFLTFLKGIPDEEMQRWYASVMLNRLMFIYFIQKKGFLDNDTSYLRSRLGESQQRGRDRFYADFLCPLFFEGFAKRAEDRSAAINQLLGNVPYLNGGLFLRHQIEELYGKEIQIADSAFEKLFAFFDQYQWHLDERPLRADNEINPDVLGYIFEKFINQKQMGAYYTKEDITGYISQNTVIPFLFDAARQQCKISFVGAKGPSPDTTVWSLLRSDPDRYIYEAMRRGVIDADGQIIPESMLPKFVQTGMHDPKVRMFDRRYNLGEADLRDNAGRRLTLPTETWREYVERRKRCLEVRQKLASGEVQAINDLITYNLDIRQFAQDVIEHCEGPELLRAFYHAIERVTVLDPTCGSGAFLFAALNILEPLYEACLDRMQVFLDELERSVAKHRPERFSDFRKLLQRVADHPNRRYFILKSIIVNNLFGVDIMEEAVEICKLRLFLKLVAQVERAEKIEPLPDIDFNIQVGNTLVGYATYDDVQRTITSKLDFEGAMERIEEKAQDVDRLFGLFRQQQTELRGEVTPADKQALRNRLKALEDELNHYLASEYGVDMDKPAAYAKWLASHKPFHWFIEFYGIIKSGGFDVIIGNPPYVELNALSEYRPLGYTCEDAGNLYALVIERCFTLCSIVGRQGFIVPVSSVSTARYGSLQRLVSQHGLCYSSFDDRPSRLFDGLEHSRLTIHLIREPSRTPSSFATRYNKWTALKRPTLFDGLQYTTAIASLVESSLPKLSADIEEGIISKLSSQKRRLSSFFARGGHYRIFYSRKVGYFIQALDFEPLVLDGQGNRRPPSEFKEVSFASGSHAAIALCCLNSNLFYWFVTVFSDCRHVNKREV